MSGFRVFVGNSGLEHFMEQEKAKTGVQAAPKAATPTQSASKPDGLQQSGARPSEVKPAGSAEQDEFRHIVRIGDTDLDGNKSLGMAIRKIKGVNFMFANLCCRLAHVDARQKLGTMKDGEIAALNKVLQDPGASGIPVWMFNRRKDNETGVDKHLLSTDLAFTKDNDIKMLKKIKTYVGVRHMTGNPVRGQKTRSNFRKNKGKVSLGVKRKEGSKAGRV